jgi:thiamine pyrophosphate-dependent acetolactate synthase large subunit-like protein
MLEAADVFKVFQKHRGDAIVIPTGTSGRQWMNFTTNEKRDLSLGGAMGHTAAAALGLALALPSEKVVLFDADGALLMNLGILATISGMKPQNFYHFLLDNECYATTGGQPVPNAKEINYAGIAKEWLHGGLSL